MFDLNWILSIGIRQGKTKAELNDMVYNSYARDKITMKQMFQYVDLVDSLCLLRDSAN